MKFPFVQFGFLAIIAVGPPIACLSRFLSADEPAIAWNEPRRHYESSPSIDRSEAIDWTGENTEQNRMIERDLRRQFEQLWLNMSEDAQAGFRRLTETPYLPADFDEEILERLDDQSFVWPLQDQRLPSDHRQRTWMRFGLSPRPHDATRPLQYVTTPEGGYVMNCFACHGGSPYGGVYPGAPNTLYALESLTEQVRRSKLSLGKPLGHMEIGSMAMPLGTTVGSSNAVMFGVALMNFRDAELNVHPDRLPAALINHDMDAPPWWHFHRKHHIYIEGFAEKGHRGLMQFMLVKQNGPKQFQEWENDFRKVYAFLSELRAPKYPLAIDVKLSETGRKIFEQNCAGCHGTYGNSPKYPEIRVPLDEIGTDPVRLRSLTPEHRRNYGQSWFADYGRQNTVLETDGYVAPPLDGLWASAPYLHNGSVPTLWHLLHPDARPVVWTRTQLGMDVERVGLGVHEFTQIPEGTNKSLRRWYYDTRAFGKSSAGHDFPNALTDSEKDALLEYLKTL